MAEKSLLQGLFPLQVNVGEGVFRSNILSAIERDLPWLQQCEEHGGQVVIVAGGPSLADSVGQIRLLVDNGFKVIAVNNTANWLLERDIVPDYQIILDARPSCERFITKHEGVKFLIASQCSPSTFDAAGETTLWHPHVEGVQELIGTRKCALIGGGTTVGLQALAIAYTLGYRRMHLVGYDSSYRDGEGHAYKQPENDGEPLVDVLFDGKRYVCARWMVHQVEEFKGVLRQLVDGDCEISMGGDGFLPATFRDMLKTVLTAVYDLAVSPPTYDFVSFLLEAEKARIEQGHTHLDVVFMPGPIGGFRDDDLPPSVAVREGMLHRVCVGLCRLLPSVRNVTVRKDRQPVEGNIFPAGWTVLTPISHYGSKYLRDAKPVLRATPAAREAVKRSKPYVTITLREADYWPRRNSNLDAWAKVARWLESEGYEVVTLRDTEKDFNALAWDIDLRLALYEGADVNLGVTNGPMALMFASGAPYIVFKVVTEEYYSTSYAFLRIHGMNKGDQWGANGITVWADDDYDTIRGAVQNALGLTHKKQSQGER